MNIALVVGFTEKHCGTCGVVFFVPDALEREFHRTGQAWTCPNGHRRSYAESDADKYQRLYEAEKDEHVKTARIKLNAIASAERLAGQLEKCKKPKRKRVKK